MWSSDVPRTTLTEVTASMLRQYSFCPRIPYYMHTRPVPRPVTPAMEMGQERQVSWQRLERHRTYQRYALEAGERQFNLRVESNDLGLSGVIDLAIIHPRGVFPVECKDSPGGLMEGHRLQLGAYALMLEECFQRPSPVGFVYFLPARRVVQVPIDTELRARVTASAERLRLTLMDDRKPDSTPHRSRCADCEFRRYCPDTVSHKTPTKILFVFSGEEERHPD